MVLKARCCFADEPRDDYYGPPSVDAEHEEAEHEFDDAAEFGMEDDDWAEEASDDDDDDAVAGGETESRRRLVARRGKADAMLGQRRAARRAAAAPRWELDVGRVTLRALTVHARELLRLGDKIGSAPIQIGLLEA